MTKKIRDTGKQAKRIIDIGPKAPRVDPEEVRKALGAERMTPEETAAFLRRVHGTSESQAGQRP